MSGESKGGCYEIIAGHTRVKAARQLGLETVPCVIANDLTAEQIKAFRLADNKTAELAEWNMAQLEQELLRISDIDMDSFGFDVSKFESADVYAGVADAVEENRETLQERFIVPPFSILDTRQGYWQDRKKVWKKILKSGNGRADSLLGDGLQKLIDIQGAELNGTSIFDPVLCEVMLNWFCPAGGKVLDPFAGGSVRGLVSAFVGNEYTGIDLSAEQIAANEDNYKALHGCDDFTGEKLKHPKWITADSADIDSIVKEKHDFMLTCPPYADLEVYSDDPRDISNMQYDDFLKAYRDIIKKSASLLNENAFAVIVVGDVRDKKGYYRNFVRDTVQAASDAGLKFYNDCILVEQVATAALRANKQFSAWRKVVKTHQNVLVFVKGNEKEIPLIEYEYKNIAA